MQMLSVELSSSNVCRQYFVVKRVQRSTIFVFTTKTTQPRPQVISVNGASTCNCAAFFDVIG